MTEVDAASIAYTTTAVSVLKVIVVNRNSSIISDEYNAVYLNLGSVLASDLLKLTSLSTNAILSLSAFIDAQHFIDIVCNSQGCHVSTL
jgi:hypothetical protein